MENKPYQSYSESATSTFPLFMRKVYTWMTIALAITGVTALVASTNYGFLNMLHNYPYMMWGLLIAEVGLVMYLSARIQKLSVNAATSMFILYSFLSGVTLSTIFLVYTGESIATTFFITAGVFAAMSIYGWVTKRDLTSIGSMAMMALIGLIIASVVNIFLASSMLYWIISCVGVLIFVGLIAYDTQKLKELSDDYPTDDDATHKVALLGALSLYLDLINLFLMLLRFFGNRD